MFAGLGALEVLAPFVGDDLGLDAHLGPVGLEHFGHQLGVGVVRALHRHGPEGDLGAFLDAGGLEQLLGLFRVVAGVLDGLVIGPLGRRHAVHGQLAGALVHGVDDGLLVHRHVQRLAHFELVQRLVRDVVGDVAIVEARLRRHLQVRVVLQRFQVGRTWEEGDLAFVGLELLHAHRSIGADREDQVVDLHVLGLPVILVAGETDLRVLLVTLEHEGAGADGFLVDVGGLALFEQLVGIFGGVDGGEAHGHVLDEGCIHTVEGELDGVVVDLLHPGDVGVHAHVGEVGEFGGVRLAEGVVLVEHALEGEEHVVGVEVAGRLEVIGGVELDALAQVEGVGEAIGGNVPLLGKARDHCGAAALELGQAVEDGFGGGVEIGAGGVLARIETGGAAFGAEHQVACSAGEGCAGDQPSRDKCLDDGVFTHVDLMFILFVIVRGPLWGPCEKLCRAYARGNSRTGKSVVGGIKL
ncbi:hypothetical protein D9M68_555130 [compost metagenome]